VVEKVNDVYYACIGGKEVCSEEQDKIPLGMIEDFKQRRPSPSTPASPTMVTRWVSSSDLTAGTQRPPVSDDDVKALAVGASRSDLLQKLGAPHMKLTGDTEYYTYLLASGNSAQVELEGGKITHVQIVRMK
jgi:hypothetical protein